MKNKTRLEIVTIMRESWSIAHFRIRGEEHLARVLQVDIDLVILIITG